jgi:hypothetical protein
MQHNLTLQQRAYALGYRRARREMSRELEQLRDWLEREVQQMRSQLRLARQELGRRRAFEVADAAMRDFGAWLH